MKSRVPPPDLTPQSPAAAFERFVELVRSSPSGLFYVQPDVLQSLVRPFLANPHRDEPHVREIMFGYAAATMAKAFRESALLRAWWKLLTWRRGKGGSIDENAPDLVSRLESLEAILRRELRPGSITLYLKPARYVDSPSGFGDAVYHRYRVQLQTLIESTADDALQAVVVEFTVLDAPNIVVDSLSPEAGFSMVGLKSTVSVQAGLQTTETEKAVAGSELSGGGAKMTGSVEETFTRQATTTASLGGEETHARVEQYLIARKAGSRAIWRAIAGVGPVDAGGAEYGADLLVPDGVDTIDLRFEARVEWFKAGVVPAELRRSIALPRPTPHGS